MLITIGWRIFCCGASCELKLFGGQIGQTRREGGKEKDKTPEEIVAIAKEAGFDFTVDELKESARQVTKLSLDELDIAAGGYVFPKGVTNDALVKAAEVGTDIAGAIKTVKNTANELATDVADAFKEAPGEIRAKGAEVANDFATKHYDNCVVRFLVNLGNKI